MNKNNNKELNEIRKELDILKTSERRRIAELISRARAHGDIRENSEYDNVKEEQAYLEAQIRNLELRLLSFSNAGERESYEAGIGSTIVFLKNGEKKTMMLVPPESGDPENMKLSIDSSLGSLIFGKKAGDHFSVDRNGKSIVYEIESVG